MKYQISILKYPDFFCGISKEAERIDAVLRKENLDSASSFFFFLFFFFKLLLCSFLLSRVDRENKSMDRPHLLSWSENTNTQRSDDSTGSAVILTLAKPMIFGNR